MLGGEPLKLFAPRVVDAAPGIKEPGTIRDVTPAGVFIACGDADQHLIAFAEIQFPGKRRMPAALARDRLPPGTRLGS